MPCATMDSSGFGRAGTQLRVGVGRHAEVLAEPTRPAGLARNDDEEDGDMTTQRIDVPEEILGLLQRSRLGSRAGADQVRAALAIHLFLEGLVSIGKAAELASVPRVEFESLLVDMGLPT